MEEVINLLRSSDLYIKDGKDLRKLTSVEARKVVEVILRDYTIQRREK